MNKKFGPTIAIAVVGFFLFMILTSSTFLTIDAGERGVLFRPFSTGLDKENIYPLGQTKATPMATQGAPK